MALDFHSSLVLDIRLLQNKTETILNRYNNLYLTFWNEVLDNTLLELLHLIIILLVIALGITLGIALGVLIVILENLWEY